MGGFDFLFIVSAPGPGQQRFGYVKYMGAPETFVGGVGLVVVLSNYSISSWPWLVNIWSMPVKRSNGYVRAKSLTIIEFINQ